jgi:argininosuccinate lyase
MRAGQKELKVNLWGGRFSKGINETVRAFNQSLPFDKRMYAQDIRGSVAHARMLGAAGIIEADEAGKIIAGLQRILDELEAGTLTLPADAEDIHMCVETLLTERLGETGKRLHTARSRNDQVALDLRLYVKAEINIVIEKIKAFRLALIEMAKQHLDTVMPGYTHLQRAQPITLAHHLMAWCEMLKRDAGRLTDALARMDELPLGAGALAGVTYPIDRAMTAEELGFARITANSLDAVSDRDFVIETLAALSLVMVHLSRMSEEVILWTGAEFGFAMLDDAFSTGSSIMPQKKNPDVAELTRGKTGRVAGALMAQLMLMKGLPLAYNKDIQEDKEAVFDALDTVKICLDVFPPMLQTLTFNKEAMERAAARGFLNATDAADYLVKKGMAFRDAYTLVGKLVAHCVAEGLTLEELTLEFLRQASGLFGGDFYDAVKLQTCVAVRNVPGGPAPDAVKKHIEASLTELEGSARR